MPRFSINQISYTTDSFGITQTSLRNLRDWIADHRDQQMCVIQVKTEDQCCGFVCILKDGSAFYTGDGFRTDGGGEGGAGYRTANAILQIWNLAPLEVFDHQFDLEAFHACLSYNRPKMAEHKLLLQLNKHINFLDESDFRKPGDPQYLRPAMY